MTTPRNYTFYKFVCINDDVKSCYVGSTANIKKRRTDHKSRCHNENSPEYNLKIYQTIRENGGWSNWKIIELGTRDNITKREAEQIEEQYRVELKADINMRRAFLTEEQKKEDKKEYDKDNKEQKKEYYKEYYQDNKEKIAEQTKEYRDVNKEKIKEYRDVNKEKIKEYRDVNKEKIKEQQNEKHDCPCGGRYTHQNKIQHFKTKKHKKYINMSQE
jgi:hypothetical protein